MTEKKHIGVWTICIALFMAIVLSVFLMPRFGIALESQDSNREPETVHIAKMEKEPDISTENLKETMKSEPETITPVETEKTPEETVSVDDEVVEDVTITPETTQTTPKTETKQEEQKQELPKVVEKLKPSGGYSAIDMSAYNAEEKILLNTVLEKIKTCYSHDLSEENIYLEDFYSFESYYKVASYFYVYYGQKRAVDETFDIVNYQDSDGTHSVYIRMRYDDIREFETELAKNKQKIDSILSTFNAGSEQEILRQIADYLRNNITYTNNYYDLSNALAGRSVCNGYALAFNAMANRAGITTDMCIGKVNGIYHAWNRVTLSDGSYRFYDITFYDSNGNAKYLHSKTSPHTNNYLINDYTACWFKY